MKSIGLEIFWKRNNKLEYLTYIGSNSKLRSKLHKVHFEVDSILLSIHSVTSSHLCNMLSGMIGDFDLTELNEFLRKKNESY